MNEPVRGASVHHDAPEEQPMARRRWVHGAMTSNRSGTVTKPRYSTDNTRSLPRRNAVGAAFRQRGDPPPDIVRCRPSWSPAAGAGTPR